MRPLLGDQPDLARRAISVGLEFEGGGAPRHDVADAAP